jgi:carbon monoxide dehydrogenase subunit G
MELKNDFHVSVPIDVAWAVLTDLERIAPCMPGAELQEVEGDEYRGVVKVKVGPISAQYKGSARFVEKDDKQHRAVLLAEGRDTRGQGNASATVTALAVPDDDGTTITITTELTITGKVAQFGRSAMDEISAKMLTEFAERLEADVISQSSASEPSEPTEPTEPEPDSPVTSEATPEGTDRPSVRKIPSAPVEPINLLGAAGPSVVKRAAPLAAVVGLVLLLWRRRRRQRTSRD